MRSRVASFLFAAAWSVSALAEPTKDQCVDADTKAQTLRMQGKLHDARAQLDVCTSPACPAMVRQDCTERLDELNRVAPSLIFDVKDSSGRDVTDASVTMDGKPLVDRIGAEAVAVDPGEHDLVFSARGHLPNKLHVLVHEGDKDRRVNVTVGTAAAAPPPEEKPETTAAPPPTARTEEPAEQPEKPAAASGGANGMRVAGVALGVTGVLGLALGGVFAGLAESSWQDSLAICSPGNCPSATRESAFGPYNTANDYATASTATFILGGVLAAAGIVLFVFAPHHHAESAIRATPMVGAGGGGLMLSGVFR